MGLFKKDQKKLEPVKCVYAGPEYFNRKRDEDNNDVDIEDVYNGPEPVEEPVSDEQTECEDTSKAYPENYDVVNKQQIPEGPIAEVYAGPERMMMAYAGPALNRGDFGIFVQANAPEPEPDTVPEETEDKWTCTRCEAVNTGKFCINCGSPRETDTSF